MIFFVQGVFILLICRISTFLVYIRYSTWSGRFSIELPKIIAIDRQHLYNKDRRRSTKVECRLSLLRDPVCQMPIL